MSEKDPQNDEEMARLALAEQLEELARGLKRGRLRVGARECPLPERLPAQIKVKEKHGEVGVKVRFRFQVAAVAEEVPPEVRHRQMSFKEVKRKLGVVFGDLLKSAVLGVFPEESRVQEYLELSKEFVRLADPAWEAEAQEYLDHVENLGRALQNREFEMFRHELRDLQHRMNTCHREFK